MDSTRAANSGNLAVMAKARIGRPPLGKSETTLYNIKVPIADLKRWRAAAKRAEQSLSEWLRTIANKEAGR